MRGLTPCYQIIRAICEDKSDNTELTLIYANRSEADILLRKQLDRFAATCNNKFTILYMIDKPTPGWTGGTGFVNKELLQKYMPAASSDCKVLLCGPPGMVNATKKNLVELGFEAPGAVSKISDQIFIF